MRAYSHAPSPTTINPSGKRSVTCLQRPKPTFAVLSYSGRSGTCTMRSRSQCEKDAAATRKIVIARYQRTCRAAPLGMLTECSSQRQHDNGAPCLGQSRHFSRRPITSGLPRSTDIVGASRHVSNVSSADLLNHLVGDSPDQTRLLVF